MPKREEPQKTAFLALIRGRVQGVGFRYEARSVARSLGICGWISNLPDGGVETYVEGPDSAVSRFQQWLQHGPPGAQVQSVDISERKPKGTFTTFSVE
jgi:acylphosphatase